MRYPVSSYTSSVSHNLWDYVEVTEYLRTKYGADAVFTVWNEEDANRIC